MIAYYSSLPLGTLWMTITEADGRSEHRHYRVLKDGRWKVWVPKRCRYKGHGR